MAKAYVRRVPRRSEMDGPYKLIQEMPEHRARIDPLAIPDVACIVYAIRAEYDVQARKTWSGLKGRARDNRKAHIRWAKMMRAACDALTMRLMATVDLRLVDEARREFLSGLVAAQNGV